MLKFSNGLAVMAKLISVLCLVGVASTKRPGISRDFSSTAIESFEVYWNVPTYTCQKLGVDFEPLLKKNGITVNNKDSFRGEKIIILYDPGLFPIMLEEKDSHKLKERNGGIPQLGKINDHLDEFNKVLEKAVPRDFSGIGIIDFEAWRPIFRQNWNDQVIYRNMSKDLVRQEHPQWTEKQINDKAKVDFENAAKVFMEETLKMAKIKRPNARWGYYGFPYCYNTGKDKLTECVELVRKENDQIHWMFEESTGLYPSVYSSSKLTVEEHAYYITGRMNEAWRVASKVSKTDFPRVYPYVWYRFNDVFKFMEEERMFDALDIMRQYKIGGAIIWGSSNDLRTVEKCKELYKYVEDVLGPVVLRVKQNGQRSANVAVSGLVSGGRRSAKRRGAATRN